CLAADRPLVLALEDVHWADPMSLRLLAFLGRRAKALPVLIVVTAREEELRSLDDDANEGACSWPRQRRLSDRHALTTSTGLRPAIGDETAFLEDEKERS